MAVNFKSEEEVREYLKNLGIEYRFGCYSEKRSEVCDLLGDYLEAIDRNYEKAAKLYQSTCDDYKYGRSCSKFATYALLGRGMRTGDCQMAYKYFEKACNLGETKSCFHQGVLLVPSASQTEDDPIRLKIMHSNPVKTDLKRGISVLEKACNADEPNACFCLSGIYIAGDLKDDQNVHIQKDMEKAFKFALKGCELNHMQSCANVSQMFSKGEGVQKDQVQADKYKSKALELQSEVLDGKPIAFQQGLD